MEAWFMKSCLLLDLISHSGQQKKLNSYIEITSHGLKSFTPMTVIGSIVTCLKNGKEYMNR